MKPLAEFILLCALTLVVVFGLGYALGRNDCNQPHKGTNKEEVMRDDGTYGFSGESLTDSRVAVERREPRNKSYEESLRYAKGRDRGSAEDGSEETVSVATDILGKCSDNERKLVEPVYKLVKEAHERVFGDTDDEEDDS